MSSAVALAEDMSTESEEAEGREEVLTAAPDESPSWIDRPRMLVHLPTGNEWLEPAMAAACNAELGRQRKQEEEQAAYEEVRRDYYLKVGKRYPGRTFPDISL